MNHPELLVGLFVTLVVLAAAAYLFSRASRRKAGLPEGRVLYSDTGAWRKVEKPYYDPEWGLAGKPDYVIQTKSEFIPVEVKSNSTGKPYDSHIMQLAAYCRLVQVATGKRPTHGLIKYNNREFEIDYTTALEERLKFLIDEVRCTDFTQDVPRSHGTAARCQNCGYFSACDQRLDLVR